MKNQNQKMHMNQSEYHQPVLLADVLRLLDAKPGESYFDATAGYGGHAAAVLDKIGQGGRIVLVDRDSRATRYLEEKFGDLAEVVKGNYQDIASELVEDGSLFDMILLDLGVSSPQIDNPERGFSFRQAGPLDMRMDQSQGLTAADIVNNYSLDQLAKIISQYGEERLARRVARTIVTARPFKTTVDLARAIREAVPRSGDIDPATRTFQALRIAVNSELTALEESLPIMLNLLTPGGRIAAISFHSLEDRIVKQWIERESKDCICPPESPICICGHQKSLIKLTTGVVKGDINDAINPRASSAKLRAAKKINQKQKEDQK